MNQQNDMPDKVFLTTDDDGIARVCGLPKCKNEAYIRESIIEQQAERIKTLEIESRQAADALAKLTKEYNAARKDKERLDWLEETPDQLMKIQDEDGRWYGPRTRTIRQAIDAAMKREMK